MKTNDKVTASILNHITVKNGWYGLGVLFMIYLASNLYIYSSFPLSFEQFYLQISTLILTIYALALIMVTSNAKLWEASQEEIKAFVGTLEKVTFKLDSLILKLTEISEILSKQEAHRKGKEAERIKRLKPILEFKRVDTKFLGWVDRYEWFIVNNGPKALNVTIKLSWHRKDGQEYHQDQVFSEIDIGKKSRQFYLDDIDRVARSRVSIHLSYMDSEYRPYSENPVF